MKDGLATLFIDYNIDRIIENVEIANQVYKNIKESIIKNIWTWKSFPLLLKRNIINKVLFYNMSR